MKHVIQTYLVLILFVFGVMTLRAQAEEKIPVCPAVKAVTLVGASSWSGDEPERRSELSGAVVVGKKLFAISNEGTGKRARNHVIQIFSKDDEGRYVFQRDEEFLTGAKSDKCREDADFEAMTHFGGRLYAITSHSRNRKNPAKAKSLAKLRKRLSMDKVRACSIRSKIISFKLSSDGGLSEKRPSSLRTFLDNHAILGSFARLASKENGVDIEGLAATPLGLFVGFRGPVLRGNFVPVLRIAHDMSVSSDKSRLFFVRFDGRGIRDMAAVGNRIYFLAGPNGDQDQSFRIYQWHGKALPKADGSSLSLLTKPVCDLGPFPGAKAKPEGIAVIGERQAADGKPEASKLLVVYDATSFRAEIQNLP